MLHFGLGNTSGVDSLLVTWPDGKTQVIKNPPRNRTLTLDYERAIAKPLHWEIYSTKGSLFKELRPRETISFRHEEDDLIDFNNQRTIPHKFSQGGPGIAVGDVNQDGLEDVVIGASAGRPTILFKQLKNGSFSPRVALSDHGKPQEDTGLLLFDADADGDLDLFVTSGGAAFNTTPECYQHRIYLNDSKGNYKLSRASLPPLNTIGSCVRAADFDQDGDLDLFVGGRVSASGYPLAGESILLQNTHGIFQDVTASMAKGLQRVGMVTDALWSDVDDDGRVDLVVAGEFMAVTFFKNNGDRFTKLEETGIENSLGWWNSIAGGDFDADGDTDYIIGNLGDNNSYQASAAYPLHVFAKDFDGNGSIDPVLACYMKVSMQDPAKKLFPIHFWDELNTQSPLFRRKFKRFKNYARATMDQLLTEEEKKGALVLQANDLKTSYLENLGKGHFKLKALPVQVQVAPVNGMVVGDFNGDANLDVAMVGNNFSNEVFAGRYDAFTGLVLLGDGRGEFDVVESAESDFYVPHDAKGLASVFVRGNLVLMATQNRDSLRCFQSKVNPNLTFFEPGQFDSFGELALGHGRKQKIEFYYGSGYLSQSSRKVTIDPSVRKLKVYDFSGRSREIIFEQEKKLP